MKSVGCHGWPSIREQNVQFYTSMLINPPHNPHLPDIGKISLQKWCPYSTAENLLYENKMSK